MDPIVKAIGEGDVGTVRLLVKTSGCNLLTANKLGWIPLHEAAYYGQYDCMKILLKGSTFFPFILLLSTLVQL